MRKVEASDPEAVPPKSSHGRAPRNEIRDMEVGEVRAVPYRDASQVRSLIWLDKTDPNKGTQNQDWITWKVKADPAKGRLEDELYIKRIS